MKPIIVEMRDLSDSVEVYESKPSPFIMYTIYAILACILGAVIWASIFKLDDVVTLETESLREQPEYMM